MEVNGQPWPYLEVEPRKYRFRLYNTALADSIKYRVKCIEHELTAGKVTEPGLYFTVHMPSVYECSKDMEDNGCKGLEQ